MSAQHQKFVYWLKVLAICSAVWIFTVTIGALFLALIYLIVSGSELLSATSGVSAFLFWTVFPTAARSIPFAFCSLVMNVILVSLYIRKKQGDHFVRRYSLIVSVALAALQELGTFALYSIRDEIVGFWIWHIGAGGVLLTLIASLMCGYLIANFALDEREVQR